MPVLAGSSSIALNGSPTGPTSSPAIKGDNKGLGEDPEVSLLEKLAKGRFAVGSCLKATDALLDTNKSSSRYAASKTELRDLEEHVHAGAQQQFIIAGASGGGKSGVANALIDLPDFLPVGSSGAVTNVPVVISYDPSRGKHSFSAVVKAINVEKWKETLLLIRNQAWEQIQLVHPQLTREGLRRHTDHQIDLLINNLKNQFPLGSFFEIEETQYWTFKSIISPYLGSAVPPTTTASAPASRRINPAATWPLIESVEISIWSPLLELGAVIVDSPGLKDAVRARSAKGRDTWTRGTQCSEAVAAFQSRASQLDADIATISEKLKAAQNDFFHPTRRTEAQTRFIQLISKQQELSHQLEDVQYQSAALSRNARNVSVQKEMISKVSSTQLAKLSAQGRSSKGIKTPRAFSVSAPTYSRLKSTSTTSLDIKNPSMQTEDDTGIPQLVEFVRGCLEEKQARDLHVLINDAQLLLDSMSCGSLDGVELFEENDFEERLATLFDGFRKDLLAEVALHVSSLNRKVSSLKRHVTSSRERAVKDIVSCLDTLDGIAHGQTVNYIIKGKGEYERKKAAKRFSWNKQITDSWRKNFAALWEQLYEAQVHVNNQFLRQVEKATRRLFEDLISAFPDFDAFLQDRCDATCDKIRHRVQKGLESVMDGVMDSRVNMWDKLEADVKSILTKLYNYTAHSKGKGKGHVWTSMRSELHKVLTSAGPDHPFLMAESKFTPLLEDRFITVPEDRFKKIINLVQQQLIKPALSPPSDTKADFYDSPELIAISYQLLDIKRTLPHPASFPSGSLGKRSHDSDVDELEEGEVRDATDADEGGGGEAMEGVEAIPPPRKKLNKGKSKALIQ
ncbi:hypothetical protein MNV49_005141 [Pseudohyphozyma bogoriensis]|nr:hypothetical protein MNV49_005141 [Pseudohyphozyma bogoriensis]